MFFFFAAFAELLDNSLDEVIELPLLFGLCLGGGKAQDYT